MTRLAVLLAATVGFLAGCGAGEEGGAPISGARTVQSDVTPSGPTYSGARPGVPIPVPAVTLRTDDGAAYDLRAADPGLVRLFFFGYVNCPDVCPTTMADLAAALRRVSPEVRAKSRVFFVTTDPARDTAEVLDEWLGRYDPSFVGLTGTDATIKRAADGLKVAVLGKEPRPGGGYDVLHGTQVVAVTPDDLVHLMWFSGTSVKQYAADITTLVQNADAYAAAAG